MAPLRATGEPSALRHVLHGVPRPPHWSVRDSAAPGVRAPLRQEGEPPAVRLVLMGVPRQPHTAKRGPTGPPDRRLRHGAGQGHFAAGQNPGVAGLTRRPAPEHPSIQILMACH